MMTALFLLLLHVSGGGRGRVSESLCAYDSALLNSFEEIDSISSLKTVESK